MKTKYEYDEQTFHQPEHAYADSHRARLTWLNDLGEQGWQVVHVSVRDELHVYLLMREQRETT